MKSGLIKASPDGENGLKFGPAHKDGLKDSNNLEKKKILDKKNCC